MRAIIGLLACCIALSAASAQGVTTQPPGVLPPVPAPGSSVPMTVQPPRSVQPKRLETFGDRVTNCIHSYPLNAGVGNNPTNRDAYVRQCAN